MNQPLETARGSLCRSEGLDDEEVARLIGDFVDSSPSVKARRAAVQSRQRLQPSWVYLDEVGQLLAAAQGRPDAASLHHDAVYCAAGDGILRVVDARTQHFVDPAEVSWDQVHLALAVETLNEWLAVASPTLRIARESASVNPFGGIEARPRDRAHRPAANDTEASAKVETVGREELVQAVQRQWRRIRRDLSEASRNGLATAAREDHNRWRLPDAIEWAKRTKKWDEGTPDAPLWTAPAVQGKRRR